MQGGAVERGVAYLTRTQLTDGSFRSESSSRLYPFVTQKIYRTTFTPALMLASLAKTAQARGICDRLAAWLLAQRSSLWSFNYWATDAPERQSLPYPDDLDDTFCALLGLKRYNPELVGAEALGCIAQLLVAAETRVGGPYRTWLTAADAPAVWRDIDIAVNSNIACFLALVDTTLPNVMALLEQAIADKQFTSPYYPSEYPVIYYLARAYRGPKKAQLVRHILRLQQDGHWGTPLQTALMLSALRALGQNKPQAKGVRFILEQQAADGSWPAEAFCLDPAQKGEKFYSGSAALTTAFVLEALQMPPEKVVQPKVARPADARTEHIATCIHEAATTQCLSLTQPLRAEAGAQLAGMEGGKHGREITLLPYMFARSTAGRKTLPDALFIELGLANLYGWLAYTIFDDFLDDEGRPTRLPVATTALRWSIAAFGRALPKHGAYQAYVQHVFDRIDAANAWEVTHCRFALQKGSLTVGALPSYHNPARLYERSLGHVLTPVGVLVAQGEAVSGDRVRALVTGLSYYLAARQLNDDLHDWEQDLRAGHASSVVAAIMQDIRIRPGTYNVRTLLPRLQEQFWHHTLLDKCDDMSRYTTTARRAFRQAGVQPSSSLESLLDGIDESVALTKAEQAKAAQFLAAYKQA